MLSVLAERVGTLLPTKLSPPATKLSSQPPNWPEKSNMTARNASSHEAWWFERKNSSARPRGALPLASWFSEPSAHTGADRSSEAITLLGEAAAHRKTVASAASKVPSSSLASARTLASTRLSGKLDCISRGAERRAVRQPKHMSAALRAAMAAGAPAARFSSFAALAKLKVASTLRPHSFRAYAAIESACRAEDTAANPGGNGRF
eukprot:scaffold264147_cov30-Tisochrysis_lutea.AAC.1